MHFFFDESGDFRLPNSPDLHKTAVVMGVGIADTTYDSLRKAFDSFRVKLDSSECKKGEPKGSLLSYEHRREFCEMLASYDGISLTPVTLDLSALSKDGKFTHEHTYHTLFRQAEGMLYTGTREQMKLTARQYKNLSLEQHLRIYSLANCIKEALHHAVLFLSNRGHENSWNCIRYEIDRVHRQKNSREEKVFSLMILAWLCGWSQRRPMELIREIHTPDHPFVQLYDKG